MDFTTFGRTGLKVSVAGLGCGGNSRLGLETGLSEGNAIAVVHAALDLGINLIDTANRYGTEDVVGRALAGRPRDKVVISTKVRIHEGSELFPADTAVKSLEESLRTLRTDYIDIFHIHGLPPQHYDYVKTAMLPLLEKARAAGKFRFLGVTEFPKEDPGFQTLPRAVADDGWDAIMIACHMLHQKPVEHVIRPAVAKGIGVLLMYVVRSIFSRDERLASALSELADQGVIARDLATGPNPLGFLVHQGGGKNLTDAAYRYGRYETGGHVVLTGTGSVDHLKANVASILSPRLPAADMAKLRTLFGASNGVGLDAPSRKNLKRA